MGPNLRTTVLARRRRDWPNSSSLLCALSHNASGGRSLVVVIVSRPAAQLFIASTKRARQSDNARLFLPVTNIRPPRSEAQLELPNQQLFRKCEREVRCLLIFLRGAKGPTYWKLPTLSRPEACGYLRNWPRSKNHPLLVACIPYLSIGDNLGSVGCAVPSCKL